MKSKLIILATCLSFQSLYGQINNKSTTPIRVEKNKTPNKEDIKGAEEPTEQTAPKKLSIADKKIQYSLNKMNEGKFYIGLVPELMGNNGVYVLKVIENSPAAAAGILKGDLIREYNGKIIRSVNIITSLLNKSELGDISQWTIRRDNEEFIVPIELIENIDFKQAEQVKKAPLKKEAEEKTEPVHLILSAGLSVQMEKDQIKVTAINANGKAHKADIQVGDIITHVNKNELGSAKELADILNSAFLDSKYKLTVLRNSKNKKFTIQY